ncbi:membrane protein insertase YidC [Metamycoplasma auris]|uniref:YidC/Oxa1 family membrane protein insertase n=1 Tax=Metamycoplasma auris TaxID=51363 RepID=A0A2W7G8Y1_9BACT|nr:membrane protein insertase YidC [Metamycoplasma auris]PZW01505.1 YidC/Oxa1 family membrane protein insertase [Metamycoplasma auris]
MAKNNNSKHYDAFRINKTPEDKQPKYIWKKVWKWIKIAFIIFFISIGLVGCVQSFATKSGNKVGTGHEIYTKADYVSPNIATLRWNEDRNEFIVPNTNSKTGIVANTYLGLEDKEQIKALKEQDRNNGGHYGIYGGNSFALQLQKPSNLNNSSEKNTEWQNISNINITNKDGQRGVVYGNGKNHIYVNFGDAKGNGRTKTYTPVNKIQDIYIPSSITFETYNKYEKQEDGKEEKTIFKTDYSHIKKLNISKTSLSTISGKSVDSILLSDIFTTLVGETFRIWINDSNNRSGFGEALSKTNKKSISDLRKLNNADLIKEWNTFVLHYKDSIGPGKITESEGFQLNKIFNNAASMFNNYTQIASLSKSNYKVKDNQLNTEVNLYQYSPINPSGNYNENAWKNNLLSNDSLIPQKHIITYKDHWSYGPFYGFFMYPVSQFMNSIIRSLGTTGWSIVLALVVTVIIVRLITFFLTAKSIFSAQKMEELNQKKAKIDAKYQAYKTDKQMQQRKQMEIAELYKKEKISPFSQLLSSFITLPILIVVFRIISTLPEIKQAFLYSIQLSATSLYRVFKAGEMQYLPILILSVGIQIIAQFMPKILQLRKKKFLRADAYQKAEMKKASKKTILLPIILSFIGVLFSAGLQIYWIIGGIFTIIQSIIVHYIQKTKWYKNKLSPWLFKTA